VCSFFLSVSILCLDYRLTKLSHLHGLLTLDNGDLVTVFLKNLKLVSSVLVTFGLSVDLGVVGLEVALVLNLATLDEADVNVGA